ncbi:MAG: hypothetical protein AAFQ80_18070 [Cyanobacteria bacterium J06621_8]
MKLIREVVKQALTTGYLTLEAEEKLKIMLRDKYELEDLEAFIDLQQATMLGIVRQESREIFAASKNYSQIQSSSSSCVRSELV